MVSAMVSVMGAVVCGIPSLPHLLPLALSLSLSPSLSYARYHIVWNNIIQDKNKSSVIDKVAKADESGLVASMKEFYGDFYAVHDSLFHFDLPLYR